VRRLEQRGQRPLRDDDQPLRRAGQRDVEAAQSGDGVAALGREAVRVGDDAAVVLQALDLPRVDDRQPRVVLEQPAEPVADLDDETVGAHDADRAADLGEQLLDGGREQVDRVALEQQRLVAGRADRGGSGRRRVDDREQARRQRRDLGAGAVVGRELDRTQPAAAEHGGQRVAHLLHVRPGRLHPVADDRPGRPAGPPARASATASA
jgi:hypothetical protein